MAAGLVDARARAIAKAKALALARAKSAVAAAPTTWVKNGRVVPSTQAGDLFAPHSWYVAPPPPPPAAEEAPAAPTAPPLPYTYVGSYAPSGERATYSLARGDRVVDAHVGDKLEGFAPLRESRRGSTRVQLLAAQHPADLAGRSRPVKSFVSRFSSVLLALALAGCAADSLHREGVSAVDHGDYEAGIAKLSDALRRDPSNLVFRMDLLSRTERAVQALISQADTARAAGDPATAERAFRRVLALEPSNSRAKNGLAQVQADVAHAERVAKAQKLLDKKELDSAEIEVRAVLEEDAAFVPAQTLLAKLQSARGPVSAVPTLKTKDSRAVTLQFRDAQTKMVFEVLARQTGLNFIFDKDVKSDGKTTIFVSQVPVESAIDLILAQNQLAKQVLADNMVLIYPATPAKQKEYQEEIVHSFYLANAAVKDVENLLKTVLGVKTLFVDERANLVVMRDTPEHIRMAEKLVSSIDVAEPEVILEVEVLEAAHTLLDQLGIRYPSAATFTPTPLSGAAAAASGGSVTTTASIDVGDAHQRLSPPES
jgi:type II secretory pathway component HofQ